MVAKPRVKATYTTIITLHPSYARPDLDLRLCSVLVPCFIHRVNPAVNLLKLY